jgi:hypothetical protein
LALQEATLVLAMIMQNFDVVVLNEKEVVPKSEGTLAPEDLRLKFVSR